MAVQISSSLHKLYEPTPAHAASLDIFFFHGLEFEVAYNGDVHLSTWRSAGCLEELWPQSWLPKDFPQIRVLSVAYGAFTEACNTADDLFLIGETLLWEILWARRADRGNDRPVILVGHGFGGIVIKQLCVHAHNNKEKPVDGADMSKFLQSIRGIFFYDTPHCGVQSIDGRHDNSRPLLRWMCVFNAECSRLHGAFCTPRAIYRWIIFGLGGKQSTAEQSRLRFRVPEASSRFGDSYITVISNHFFICRPSDTRSNKYQHLKNLIQVVESGIQWIDSPQTLHPRSNSFPRPLMQERDINVIAQERSRSLEVDLWRTKVESFPKHKDAKSSSATTRFLGLDEPPEPLREITVHVDGGCEIAEALPSELRYLTTWQHLTIHEKSIKVLSVEPNEVTGRFEDLLHLRKGSYKWKMDVSALGVAFKNLISLESLHITWQGKLELPDTIGNLTSLRSLFLRCPIQLLPDTFGDLANLEKLTVFECPIQFLPATFPNLTRLKSLEISQLNAIPVQVRNLVNLEKLNLTVVSSEAVPDLFGRLRKLKDFTLRCRAMENLVDSFGNMSSLECLHLRCEGVEELPSEFGCFPTLKKLHISNCHSLHTLPVTIGRFIRLTELKIFSCGLHSLPDSFGELPQLKDLSIWRCDYLSSLPDSCKRLSKLEVLALDGCKSMQSLPEVLCHLPKLRCMILEYLMNVTSLPDAIGNLESLQSLTIRHVSLKSLPESLGQLSGLTCLEVTGCHNLESLPESIGDLSSLKSLMLINNDCPGFRSLPDSLVKLSQLETLFTAGCKNLRVPPDMLLNLRNLKR